MIRHERAEVQTISNKMIELDGAIDKIKEQCKGKQLDCLRVLYDTMKMVMGLPEFKDENIYIEIKSEIINSTQLDKQQMAVYVLFENKGGKDANGKDTLSINWQYPPLMFVDNGKEKKCQIRVQGETLKPKEYKPDDNTVTEDSFIKEWFAVRDALLWTHRINTEMEQLEKQVNIINYMINETEMTLDDIFVSKEGIVLQFIAGMDKAIIILDSRGVYQFDASSFYNDEEFSEVIYQQVVSIPKQAPQKEVKN